MSRPVTHWRSWLVVLWVLFVDPFASPYKSHPLANTRVESHAAWVILCWLQDHGWPPHLRHRRYHAERAHFRYHERSAR